MTAAGMFDTEENGWVVPMGWASDGPPAHCRSCRAEVLWATTPKGARAPLNRDGKSHFSTCPDAQTWRKRKP